MLKRLFPAWMLCLALLAALPGKAADPPPQVIFVHGWYGETEVPVAELQKIFPGYEVTAWQWKADHWNFFKINRSSAEAEAAKLAGELKKLPEERREKVILVGHSVGGRIAIKAMAELSAAGMFIDRGIFLGAAIPDDDPAIAAAITASRRANINIYHPQDNVLRHGYETALFSNPLGAFGYAFGCRKNRLFQIRAGEYDDARPWGKTIGTHWCSRYLRSLADNIRRVDRESTDEMDDSTARSEITLPETMKSSRFVYPRGLPIPSQNREEILDRQGKWELVKISTPEVNLGAPAEDAGENGAEETPWWKRVKIHIPEYTFFLIRDPRDRVVGWTRDPEDARKAFLEVKRQLEKNHR